MTKYYCLRCGNFGDYYEIGSKECIAGLHTCLEFPKSEWKDIQT